MNANSFTGIQLSNRNENLKKGMTGSSTTNTTHSTATDTNSRHKASSKQSTP